MIKAFGTVYRLHPLFVLMMAFSVWTGYFVELLTLFGIVIIHELGHAVAAKGYGWKVAEIRLLPFGGVAVVEESESATAGQEIVVALAGPLQNALMIGFAMLMKSAGIWEMAWADYFIKSNLIIGLFNLIPVLPLDGGRITQALLGKPFAYYRTMVASAWFSMVGSTVLLIMSFTDATGGVNINLLVIAAFLFIANWFDYRNVYYRFIRFLLQREQGTDRLRKQGQYVLPIAAEEANRPLDIAKLFRREKYHMIYILGKNGSVRAVLSEQKLIRRFLSESKTKETSVVERNMPM